MSRLPPMQAALSAIATGVSLLHAPLQLRRDKVEGLVAVTVPSRRSLSRLDDRSQAEGEGFEPSVDRKAHYGFRDRAGTAAIAHHNWSQRPGEYRGE